MTFPSFSKTYRDIFNAERVQEDYNSSVSSGASSTPIFSINDFRHQGAWNLESLTAAIEQTSPPQRDYMTYLPANKLEPLHLFKEQYMSYERHQQFSPTTIDVPWQAQSRVIEMLNQTLSTTTDLKTYLRQVQWHEYMNCHQPHALFDEAVAILDEYIDLFSASLDAQDRTATNCPNTKQLAPLDDSFNIILHIKDHLDALAARLEPYAQLLRSANKLPI